MIWVAANFARAGTFVAEANTRVVEFLLGDVVELRRVHPCGGREWLVDRLGADIGLRCRQCGRHVLIERRTLERRVVRFVSRGDKDLSRAVAPTPRDAAEPPGREGRE